MRQSIILSNEYEQLFLHEAQKSGLIESLPSYADELYDSDELKEAKLLYDAQLDSQVEKKKSLLRIILLFDEIILPQAPGDYDYQRLKNEGLFKIIPFDDFYYDNPIQKEGHEQYAQYLKSAILPVAEKSLRSYFRIIPKYVEYSELVSALYDTVLLKKKLPYKYREITKVNKQDFDLRNSAYFRIADAMNMPEALKEGRFFTDVSGLIVTMFEDLCWQLQISSDNDSTIMNCEYQLASIGCECFDGKVESAIDAYKILRVECGKAIGTLPEVNSIQEVVRLKEKRHHDIHNLRQELSRLEYEIKNSGSISAAEKAAADISKASKALSVGNTVSQVTRWTTRFLLPLGVASLFMQRPEIAIGSGVVTTIGQASTIIGDLLSRKNNWLELLI